MKKQTQQYRVVHTKKQRIIGSLALLGLFVCGVMVGWGINSNRTVISEPVVASNAVPVAQAQSQETCQIIEELLLERLNPVDSQDVRDHEYNIYVYEKLIMYACPENRGKYHVAADRERGIVEALQASEDAVPVAQTQPQETCQIIEELLLERLYPVDKQEVFYHKENILIYGKLIENGCPENSGKYLDAMDREREIVAVLQPSENTQETCAQIESLLLGQMPSANGDSWARIDRAKIYANLSERGCAENSAKYVDMAKQELEIARALEDDEFDNQETIEVVETYKRLNMQAAAEEIFETAKKLTNPAIDFILEVEKIINEQ